MKPSDLKPSEAVRRLNPGVFETEAGKQKKAPNDNEQRFHDEYLVPAMKRGMFDRVQFTPRQFKLYSIRYTPDWVCTRPDGTMVCYECKPFYKNKNKVHWHPGSRERLKIAAALYPDVEFYATWRQDGEWRFERITKERNDE